MSVSPIAYLRAAQAYMLISMPTGTSTIFGVFQAILALLQKRDELHLAYKVARNGKFASEIFVVNPADFAAPQTQRQDGRRAPSNENRINDIAVFLQWTHAEPGGKKPGVTRINNL
jgi:hypothetical protein